MFTPTEIQTFNQDGFIIQRKLANQTLCLSMQRVIKDISNPPLAPVEFETDVHYPGSPTDRLSLGGNTPRRLLHAFSRDSIFRQWATNPDISQRVKQLLNTQKVQVSQNHHNCIMTKYPGFSSATLWHQDIRYWLFDQPDLVSVWLSIGKENSDNGGVHLIPGSHKQQLHRGRFDGALFLRQDILENQALIDSAVSAEMEIGDVLFFHSKTLHAAGRNNTDQVKTALVFTYHAEQNQPLVGTRSANYPDISC